MYQLSPRYVLKSFSFNRNAEAVFSICCQSYVSCLRRSMHHVQQMFRVFSSLCHSFSLLLWWLMMVGNSWCCSGKVAVAEMLFWKAFPYKSRRIFKIQLLPVASFWNVRKLLNSMMSMMRNLGITECGIWTSVPLIHLRKIAMSVSR